MLSARSLQTSGKDRCENNQLIISVHCGMRDGEVSSNCYKVLSEFSGERNSARGTGGHKRYIG